MTGSAVPHLEFRKADDSGDRASARSDASAANNHGVTAGKAGQLEKAFALFTEATKLNEQLAEPYFNRAIVLMRRERFKEAIEETERSLELNPEFRRSVILLRDRIVEEASLQFVELSVLSLHRNQEGDFGGALEAIDRALLIEPVVRELGGGPARAALNAAPHVRRAVALMGLGGTERAIKALAACQQALAIEPENIEALICRAKILGEREEPWKALAAWADIFGKVAIKNKDIDLLQREMKVINDIYTRATSSIIGGMTGIIQIVPPFTLEQIRAAKEQIEAIERELVQTRTTQMIVAGSGDGKTESPCHQEVHGYSGDELLSTWFASKHVPEENQAGLVKAFHIMVARATRPKWRGRLERGGELATLSAPLFLKKVHAEEIGKDGSVRTEIIRAIDPDLMKAIEVYLSKRRERDAGLGDAEGLRLVLERPRPKPRAKRRKHELSR